jgi:uncharacterized protein YqhQ
MLLCNHALRASLQANWLLSKESELHEMKSSNIGGQAVIEGIMMKNGEKYAIAVRKPNGEIEVKEEEYKSFLGGSFLTKLPFVRGTFNFIDSLILGMKTLTYSATFWEEETEEVLTEAQAAKQKKKEDIFMTITMIVSLVLSVSLFMILPYFISNLFKDIITSRMLRTILEAVVRVMLFVIYILAVSKMKDIQRTFMYHGAEHKCINCIEHGLELNVENVRKSSKQHKRCGTSFLFFVMFVSVIVCFFITAESQVLRVVLRLALLPVIAGISYEIIRLAGRTENPLVELLSKPGLALQNLTTKEPEDDMIEVAIQAVEAVFDWKAYQKENFGEE